MTPPPEPQTERLHLLKVTQCVRVEADPRARPSLLRTIVKRRGARLHSPLAAAQDIWCSLRGDSPGHRSRLNHHSWPHCSAGGGQSRHKCVVLAAPWHLEPGPLMPNTGATKQNLRRGRHTPGAPGTPGMQQTLTLTPTTYQAKSRLTYQPRHVSRSLCWQMLSGSPIQDTFPQILVGFHMNY